jgi:sulfatase maturation enzyme AslB (radical SAM superfamily)
MLPARLQGHFDHAVRHLYINPLEKCNLRCKICYTRKTAPMLSNAEMLEFIGRYREAQPLETITFCGGEVFALATFPSLLNELTNQGIFVQVITNGTLDILDQLENPHLVQLIVSIDGLEPYHDANRGEGNFRKSLNFLAKAQRLGFHTHIFTIITRQNLATIPDFKSELAKQLPEPIEITFHPRKPPAYLMHHPVSNIVGETAGFDFLTHAEMVKLLRTEKTFPPKEFGCYQVALVSSGQVYGCCEGVTPIGKIDDEIPQLIQNLQDRVDAGAQSFGHSMCLGCSQADFFCGMKEYLGQIYATI